MPRPVVVLGEDEERSQPLLQALGALGVPTMFWNTERGTLFPTEVPEDAVYFSRQSPSCGTRNHGVSMPYARIVLWWLEQHGRTVVNGSAALALESSKACQVRLLTQFGFNVPRTGVCATRRQLFAELRHVSYPVVVKPDMGGSGAGVHAYASGAHAARALSQVPPPSVVPPSASSYAQSARVPPTDGKGKARGKGGAVGGEKADNPDPYVDDTVPWLFQEHIGPWSDDETKVRSVLRFEIIGGRVAYVMQIRAPVTVFKLCPCDPRFESLLSKVDFKILADPLTIPCFAPDPSRFDAFCERLEALWASVGAAVGSAEAFLPVAMAEDARERTYSPESMATPNEPVIFDLNFNSNYNAAAEKAAGVDGPGAVAAMLASLATQSADGTTSESPASFTRRTHHSDAMPSTPTPSPEEDIHAWSPASRNSLFEIGVGSPVSLDGQDQLTAIGDHVLSIPTEDPASPPPPRRHTSSASNASSGSRDIPAEPESDEEPPAL